MIVCLESNEQVANMYDLTFCNITVPLLHASALRLTKRGPLQVLLLLCNPASFYASIKPVNSKIRGLSTPKNYSKIRCEVIMFLAVRNCSILGNPPCLFPRTFLWNSPKPITPKMEAAPTQVSLLNLRRTDIKTLVSYHILYFVFDKRGDLQCYTDINRPETLWFL